MDSANFAFVLTPFSSHLLVFDYSTISVTSFLVRLYFHTGPVVLYEQHAAYSAAFRRSWSSDFRLSGERAGRANWSRLHEAEHTAAHLMP